MLLVVFGPIVLVAANVEGSVEGLTALNAWLLALFATTLSASCTLMYLEIDAAGEERTREREGRSASLDLHGKMGSGRVSSYEDSGLRFGSTSGFTLQVDVGTTTVSALCVSDPNEIANWLHREVTVRYDTTDPSNAVLLSDAPGVLSSATEGSASESLNPDERLVRQQVLLDELAESGTSARAVVISYEPLGISFNEGLMVVLGVTVLPDGESTFTGTLDAALSHERLANYQVGQSIWVRYDPNDPSRVAIDFEKQGGTTTTLS